MMQKKEHKGSKGVMIKIYDDNQNDILSITQ